MKYKITVIWKERYLSETIFYAISYDLDKIRIEIMPITEGKIIIIPLNAVAYIDVQAII